MFRIILLLSFFSLPLSGVAAQDIRTNLMAISLDHIEEELFCLNDGNPQLFVSSRSGMGRPFEYRGPRQFVLRAKPDDFSRSPTPAPVASVNLPMNVDTVLLVSGKRPDGKLDLRAFDIASGSFKAGDYKFFNFSTQDLVMMMGKQQFGIRAGDEKIIADSSMRQDVIDITIRIGKIEDGQAKQIYASTWGHQPVKRNFIFLFDGRHPTSPVAIRRYSDRPR